MSLIPAKCDIGISRHGLGATAAISLASLSSSQSNPQGVRVENGADGYFEGGARDREHR